MSYKNGLKQFRTNLLCSLGVIRVLKENNYSLEEIECNVFKLLERVNKLNANNKKDYKLMQEVVSIGFNNPASLKTDKAMITDLLQNMNIKGVF